MLSWKCIPRKSDPTKTWVILGIAVGAFLVGFFAFHGFVIGLVGTLIVLASCSEYWLGAKFEVDDRGARRKVGVSVTEMTWDRVKRIVVGEDGVLISPLSKDSALGPFRGVYLQYQGNQDAVLDAIRQFGGSHVQGLV